MQILLVEDDIMIAKSLATALRRNNFTVNCVCDGRTALNTINTETPDIVILDLGLPDIDGFDVLRAIRPKHPLLPVLILTARDSVEQKVVGLDLGADDYLTKPFELPELLARLRAFERRLNLGGSTVIEMAGVTLDITANTARADDTNLELSKREYMLLKALMEGSSRIHTRQSLEAKLYDWDEEVASNAIDVHIHNLRKKLPKSFIKTVRGIGYSVNKT